MKKDTVFIDTSLFKSEHYFKDKNKISTLVKLAKDGHISIVLTEITKREILKHLEKDIKIDIENFNSIIKKFEALDKSYIHANELISLDPHEEALRLVDKFIEDSHSYIIGYEYCKNVKDIFDKYFSIKKPFGEGRKAKEFPDAFVLQSIEQYAEKNRIEKIVVLSGDGDMEKYYSEKIDHIPSKKYINRLLGRINDITELKKQYCSDYLFIQEKLESEIYDYYDGYVPQSLIDESWNDVEVNDIDSLKITCPQIPEFNIKSYEKDTFVIEIEISVSMSSYLEYTSYVNAVYDKEDGLWYGEENFKNLLKNESRVSVTIEYKMNPATNRYEYEIKEIDYDAIDNCFFVSE